MLYQDETRVFFWDVNGAIKYGTVKSTSRMTDVCILNITVGKFLLMLGVITGHASGECYCGRRIYKCTPVGLCHTSIPECANSPSRVSSVSKVT